MCRPEPCLCRRGIPQGANADTAAKCVGADSFASRNALPIGFHHPNAHPRYAVGRPRKTGYRQAVGVGWWSLLFQVFSTPQNQRPEALFHFTSRKVIPNPEGFQNVLAE
jgi:hypothetical protein